MSKRGPDLWFINRANLRQRITHPEWGLWRNHSLSKEPKTLLSVPREHKNTLTQKSHSLKFASSFWHTLGLYKCCALLRRSLVTKYGKKYCLTKVKYFQKECTLYKPLQTLFIVPINGLILRSLDSTKHITIKDTNGWLNDLLLETSKVYSGFLNHGVLLSNVSSHNFR